MSSVQSILLVRIKPERGAYGAAGPALTRGGRSRDAPLDARRSSEGFAARAFSNTRHLHTALALVKPRVAILSTVYCTERPTHV